MHNSEPYNLITSVAENILSNAGTQNTILSENEHRFFLIPFNHFYILRQKINSPKIKVSVTQFNAKRCQGRMQ